jgi:Fe-S-cluster containining protein
MHEKKFRLDLQNLQKPKNSEQMIRNAFSKVNCLECGVCCSEGPKHLTFIPMGDPNSGKLLLKAKNQFPHRVILNPLEGYYLEGGDCCAFLDRKGEENICSVYDIRPMVCAMYPFMLLGMKAKRDDGKMVELPFIALTSSCPPLRELRDAQIFFLEKGDIDNIPLLENSYRNVSSYMEQDLAISADNLIEVNGSIIFPIY